MGRPREFDEASVVEKAMELFREKGFAATSVQDLVDATGLRRGSLYCAFGDKHGLYLAALDAYLEGRLTELQARCAGATNPLDPVCDMIRELAGEAAGPKGPLGCMFADSCSELAPHDPPVRDRLQTFGRAMRRCFAGALAQAQARGTFPLDRNPDAVAAHLHCTLQGLALMGKTDPDPTTLAGIVDELLAGLT